MRFGRLELRRFGRFTDRTVELPAGDLDLHVLFGANEAGKSTTLAAIGDLLFGMPARSPYNFLHEYKDMRLGALLEGEAESVNVLRRKGTVNTLLDSDEAVFPGGEAALRPYLVGADRAFFERMFSLDRHRLEQGGREILEASDDVGRMLFAAGTGIGGLRARLAALEAEADGLWGPRRAGHRRFTQAEDKLKDAREQLREGTLTARRWMELKRDLDMTEAAHGEVLGEFETASIEARQLARVRRVYHDVTRKSGLLAAIEALGEVVELPEGADGNYAEAMRELADATARVDTLRAQLQEARGAVEAAAFDGALVARADDVERLCERRIEIRKEVEDLPKRRAELAVAEVALGAHAGELGWRETDADDLIARIAPRGEVGVLRSRLGQRGELATNLANRREALEEAKAELASLEARLAGMAEARDISRLVRVVRSIRERGDLEGGLALARRNAAEAGERVARLLAMLHPGVADVNALVAMAVPAAAAVVAHRDKAAAWERRSGELARRIEDIDGELDTLRPAYERTLGEEAVVTEEVLAAARRRREELWRTVRLGHVEGASVPDELWAAHGETPETLITGFEVAVREADATADRRFDKAEAAGRLAEIARGLAEREGRGGRLRELANELAREGEALEAAWRDLWGAAAIVPLDPESMLEWLRLRGEILEAVERGFQTARISSDLEAEVDGAAGALATELDALNVDGVALRRMDLSMLRERVAEVEREHETTARRRAEAAETVGDARTELERREREHARATAAWEEWGGGWSAALVALGLAAELEPAAVEAQLDIVERMRELTARINSLRHDRIAKIERDADDLARAVDEVSAEVAADLAGTPSGEAVRVLEQRLGEALRLQERERNANADVERLRIQIAELERGRATAQLGLDRLKAIVSARDVDELKAAIERSDTLRRLRADLEATLAVLEREGDGLAVEDLERECAGVDIDHVAAREETVRAGLSELGERSSEASDARTLAREAFRGVGGGDAAARAEALRQEALAEMREAAAGYARARTAAILLQWSIDRYLREKQTPLRERAAGHFATITGGEFSGLDIDYDEQDRARLIGRRRDDERVPVSGMSTATADQLYLALRVAAIEDYLERANPLPFVADDLFVNFDDERAKAGFGVLAQLAGATQVLFLTHHRHLVEIARAALGEAVHVVDLAGG